MHDVSRLEVHAAEWRKFARLLRYSIRNSEFSDCVAVGAVMSELVSDCNSLLYGDYTGNYSKFWRKHPFVPARQPAKNAAHSGHNSLKFVTGNFKTVAGSPLKANRELMLASQSCTLDVGIWRLIFICPWDCANEVGIICLRNTNDRRGSFMPDATPLVATRTLILPF